MLAALRLTPSDAAALPPDLRWMRLGAVALAALAVAAWLAAAGLWLAKRPLFEMSRVTLKGDLAHVDWLAVQQVLPRIEGHFWTLRLADAQAVFETLPWVRHAVVSRVWPNELVAQLEEHRPAALWLTGDGDTRLVNSHGELFDVNLGEVDEEGLVELRGPTEQASAILAMAEQLAPVLQGQLADPLAALTLSERGAWRAELDSGARLQLGRGTPPEVLARLARFTATVGEVTQRQQRHWVAADLRHEGAYALRLGEALASATAASSVDVPAAPVMP